MRNHEKTFSPDLFGPVLPKFADLPEPLRRQLVALLGKFLAATRSSMSTAKARRPIDAE